MNQIGFNAIQRPKSATERLEEAARRRGKDFDEINAIASSIFQPDDFTEMTCGWCNGGGRLATCRARNEAHGLILCDSVEIEDGVRFPGRMTTND